MSNDADIYFNYFTTLADIFSVKFLLSSIFDNWLF